MLHHNNHHPNGRKPWKRKKNSFSLKILTPGVRASKNARSHAYGRQLKCCITRNWLARLPAAVYQFKGSCLFLKLRVQVGGAQASVFFQKIGLSFFLCPRMAAICWRHQMRQTQVKRYANALIFLLLLKNNMFVMCVCYALFYSCIKMCVAGFLWQMCVTLQRHNFVMWPQLAGGINCTKRKQNGM